VGGAGPRADCMEARRVFFMNVFAVRRGFAAPHV
jgi:hypothetical protein